MKNLLKSSVLAVLATGWSMTALAASQDSVVTAAQAVEASLGARVGFSVVDTDSGSVWSYRGDERFPMASTFKTLACAKLLASGASSKAVSINQEEILTYSPVTEKLVGKRVSAGELCAATLRTSDNTAANKVLEVIGGPAGVTEFLRSIGDRTTRLDRREPTLNEGLPGDERDTTTPAAMTSTMEKLVLGSALKEREREQLTNWLIANEVGGPLLRAGFPANWRVADRTGAGGSGTRCVAAIVWPPGRKPLAVAVYLTETAASMEQRNQAIATIATAIAEQISR